MGQLQLNGTGREREGTLQLKSMEEEGEGGVGKTEDAPKRQMMGTQLDQFRGRELCYLRYCKVDLNSQTSEGQECVCLQEQLELGAHTVRAFPPVYSVFPGSHS